MSSPHADEPFFQFDPYEGLNPSSSFREPQASKPVLMTTGDDERIEMDSEILVEGGGPDPKDKGKGVSEPLPIMISSLETSGFDNFSVSNIGVSPAWSASSSYPDTPTAISASPGSPSTFPSFTLGSFSGIWDPSLSPAGENTIAGAIRPPDSAGPSIADRKGKGKERGDPPSVSPLAFSPSLFELISSSSSSILPISGAPPSSAGLPNDEPSVIVNAAHSEPEASCSRQIPPRRHSISHQFPRSRRPSGTSMSRMKAKFYPPNKNKNHGALARKFLSNKLAARPAQLAVPQLTQTIDVHTHSFASLQGEVRIPLNEGTLDSVELCMPIHALFRSKGRSNSSPCSLSALDYITVPPENVFVSIPFGRNFFDGLLPRELKLQILMALVVLHERDRAKQVSQSDWSVTRAISFKNRWLGKDKGTRELVKLSRVSRAWRDLVFDGQLWTSLDFRSFPAMSKALFFNITRSGGRFITSMDVAGHVHLGPSTLVDVTDKLCLASFGSLPSSLPFTQLTSLNFRGCTALTARSLHYLLVRSPALQQVCLCGLPAVTNTTCDIIAMYCARVTKLDLNRCPKMDADGLKRLATAVRSRGDQLRLTELRVSGLKNIDDTTMALLGQVAPFLEVLDLSYARHLHNSALAAFVAIDDDEHFACESALLTAREAGRDPGDPNRYRRRITCLRHLSLSCCILLTDIACSHLAHAVPRLEFLELAGIGEELGDDGLIRLLKTTPMIRRLDVEDATEITDAVLASITPALSELVQSSGSTSVETAVETQLEPGHALEHLVISYATSITDDALQQLISRCHRLRVLEADNTRMGPAVLRKFCELRRKDARIVAVDCRAITENVVKDLVPITRARKGWRGWDARKLRFLDGRDFSSGKDGGERDKEKEAVMKVALGQDELDEQRVVLKTFYSWQTVDAVWNARDKRRKAITRRKANESSGSTDTDTEDVHGAGGSARAGGARWWSPGGRRSRSASETNSPLIFPDPNGGDTCVIM